MYRQTTHNISVAVMPVFIDERSKPDEDIYFWAYRVIIENNGKGSVQLLKRYWHISDANGKVEEVRGDGVVGEKPTLAPGSRYEYTSGCPLSTPSGIMVGHYEMQAESGEMLTVKIPAFSLDLPDNDPVYN